MGLDLCLCSTTNSTFEMPTTPVTQYLYDLSGSDLSSTTCVGKWESPAEVTAQPERCPGHSSSSLMFLSSKAPFRNFEPYRVDTSLPFSRSTSVTVWPQASDTIAVLEMCPVRSRECGGGRTGSVPNCSVE